MIGLFRNYILHLLRILLKKIIIKLLYKYPLLFKIIKKTYITISKIYLYNFNIVYCTHNYIRKRFPLFYYLCSYVYNEYVYALNGNISTTMSLILTLFFIIGNDPYYIWLCIGLLFNCIIRQQLECYEWLQYNYPEVRNLLLKVSVLLNIILLSLLINHIMVEVITILKKLWHMLNMQGSSGDSMNNNGPSSPNPQNDPNSPNNQDPNIINSSRKKKSAKDAFKERHNLDEQESERLDLGIELIKLRKGCDELSSVGGNHNSRATIIGTKRDFTDKYFKWLPNKDKQEVNALAINANNRDKNGYYYKSAPNVYSYWTAVKRDTKLIHGDFTKFTQIFEKNSKKIQNSNLGGVKSSDSEIFRRDLNELKSVFSEDFQKKNAIINKQLGKANKIDKMLKDENINIKDLFDKKILP